MPASKVVWVTQKGLGGIFGGENAPSELLPIGNECYLCHGGAPLKRSKEEAHTSLLSDPRKGNCEPCVEGKLRHPNLYYRNVKGTP